MRRTLYLCDAKFLKVKSKACPICKVGENKRLLLGLNILLRRSSPELANGVYFIRIIKKPPLLLDPITRMGVAHAFEHDLH